MLLPFRRLFANFGRSAKSEPREESGEIRNSKLRSRIVPSFIRDCFPSYLCIRRKGEGAGGEARKKERKKSAVYRNRRRHFAGARARAQRTVQRPRVSPMFRKRAGRCCPLAGAPTSNRRRSKLGTINSSSYLPLCKLAAAHATSEREKKKEAFIPPRGRRDADRDSTLDLRVVWRNRAVTCASLPRRRDGDAGLVRLIASPPRELE